MKNINIKGIEALSVFQKELMYKINEKHTQCVGNDYKEGMEIIEVWINKDNYLCVRLKNKEWYHYSENGTWY